MHLCPFWHPHIACLFNFCWCCCNDISSEHFFFGWARVPHAPCAHTNHTRINQLSHKYGTSCPMSLFSISSIWFFFFYSSLKYILFLCIRVYIIIIFVRCWRLRSTQVHTPATMCADVGPFLHMLRIFFLFIATKLHGCLCCTTHTRTPLEEGRVKHVLVRWSFGWY